MTFFADEFENAVYWKFQNLEFDSVRGYSQYVDRDFNVINSSAALNASQGEGCAGNRIIHEVQRGEELKYIINSDSLYVKLNIEKSFIGASGALSFKLNLDSNLVVVYLPQVDVNTTFEFKIHNWQVFGTKDSEETIVWDILKTNETQPAIMIEANACGADLYADASITLKQIEIGYFELLVAE